MVTVANQKVNVNYGNQVASQNMSNPGIQIKKTHISNQNSVHRSLVGGPGHNNSPIAKNDATKVINDMKRKQFNEQSSQNRQSLQ